MEMIGDAIHLHGDLDLTSFERILPFIDDARIVYVSQPIFTGRNVTIIVTSTGAEVETRSDHALDRSWASRLCAYQSGKLRTLAQTIFEAVGGDVIRLDGTLVRLNPELSGFIDIYRIVVFDGNTYLLELPYQETIFVEDEARVPRFVMPITTNTGRHGLDLARDATSALIKSNIMDGEESVRFKGLIWIPLARDHYRPSFFVPYETNRFSEENACDWMRKLYRREFSDLSYVDHMTGIRWT